MRGAMEGYKAKLGFDFNALMCWACMNSEGGRKRGRGRARTLPNKTLFKYCTGDDICIYIIKIVRSLVK